MGPKVKNIFFKNQKNSTVIDKHSRKLVARNTKARFQAVHRKYKPNVSEQYCNVETS